MKIYTLLFAIFPALHACNNPSNPRTGYLKITGIINEKIVTAVSKEADRIHSIIITSEGGDTSSALKLGKLIHDNKISVRVEKYCLSACAQYVLPAAKTVEFVGLPILGVHQSPISINNFYNLQNVSAREVNAALAEKEEIFFKYIKVNTDISVEPLHYMEVICRVEKDGKLAVGSKWGFLIPSHNTYRRWIGKDFAGTYAYHEKELYTSARKYFPPTVSFTMIQEHKATRREFTKVPKCSTN